MKQKFNKLMRSMGYKDTRGDWLKDEMFGDVVIVALLSAIVLMVVYYG